MEKILQDFVADLSTTFPEKKDLWGKWEHIEAEENTHLMEYFSTVYPERFFDILYQNEEVFNNPEINTCFLPEVSFAELFHSNISENTKKTIWKYLQLILFQVIENVKSKGEFGESANLFQGIDEQELKSKMHETLEGLKSFFQQTTTEEEGEQGEQGGGDEKQGEGEPSTGTRLPFEEMFKNMDSENMQEHLKKLMGGKIGGLVQELVEEMKDEFKDFEQELGSMDGTPDIQDVMKKMMKNPVKLMSIMKKMTDKVKTKMQEGNNQQEFMDETANLFKEMGGKDGIMKMFEDMRKGMPNGGKNMKINMNALSKMQKAEEAKTRMRQNILQKQQQQQKLQLNKNAKIEQRPDGSKIFKIEGEEQLRSTPEDIDRIMKDLGLEEKKKPSLDPPSTGGKKKKKNNKK